MKMFKKLMAVALVAVMALSMFTACGASNSKFKDEFEDQIKGVSYSKEMESYASYGVIKNAFKGINDDDEKSKVKDKIEDAIDEAKIAAAASNESVDIYYSVDGSVKDLVKDLKSDIKDGGYTKYVSVFHEKATFSGVNAVVVIVEK